MPDFSKLPESFQLTDSPTTVITPTTNQVVPVSSSIEREYRPRYIPPTKHQPTEVASVRLPLAHHRFIIEMLARQSDPLYKTISDFIKDAVHFLIWDMNNRGGLPRTLEMFYSKIETENITNHHQFINDEFDRYTTQLRELNQVEDTRGKRKVLDKLIRMEETILVNGGKQHIARYYDLVQRYKGSLGIYD